MMLWQVVMLLLLLLTMLWQRVLWSIKQAPEQGGAQSDGAGWQQNFGVVLLVVLLFLVLAATPCMLYCTAPQLGCIHA